MISNVVLTKYSGSLVLVALLALGLGSANPLYGQCCGECSDSCSSEKGDTIVDVAVGAGSFKTLVAAVQAAGLVDTLNSKGPYTVFAPTDDAFGKLPKEEIRRLLKPENRGELTAILTYHVVPGKVYAADAVKLSSAKTANGQSFKIRVKGDKVFVDNARILKTDIMASNGVIHVIDSVILPDMRPDIVETAVEAGSFRTLVAAVKAAGLVDTLKGDGPFTVFAPTDEAFAKIPKETLASLLKPENKAKLQAILTYHVIPGELKADRVVKAKHAKTVNGSTVDFSVSKKGVFVENAKVVKADIETRNGVIHVIDTVMIPQ